MKIEIQLNQYSNLIVPVSSIQAAQSVFHQPEMQRLMSKPTQFTTFLELNDPEFAAMALEYFSNENGSILKNKLESYQISAETFMEYLAYCFSISKKSVTIDYDN